MFNAGKKCCRRDPADSYDGIANLAVSNDDGLHHGPLLNCGNCVQEWDANGGEDVWRSGMTGDRWFVLRNRGLVGYLLPTWKDLRTYDEADTILQADIGVGPLPEDRPPVPEPDEEEDVHGEPREPGHESRPMRVERPDNACDSGLASDSGHVTFVEVVEWLLSCGGRRVRCEQADAFGSVFAHLHRGLCDAGD